MLRSIGSNRWLVGVAVAVFTCLMSVQPATAASPALWGNGIARYWEGFKEHWLGFIRRQDGVIIVAVLVGSASIFILTRGKWKK